ncbi:MAG: hypothetical protein ACOY5F_03840 [Pseudomonadota bacterium]
MSRTCKVPAFIVILAGGALQPQLASAQSCALLNSHDKSQGDLFAVHRTLDRVRGRSVYKVTYLEPGLAGRNQIPFDEKVRLVYVIESSGAQSRDFSGALAVRLVSSAANSTQKEQPKHVHLSRDQVRSRGQVKPEWTRSVDALRYYNYHNPYALRSSDSLLEREFHTEYQYRANEPEKATHTPADRRRQFHFPEMRAAEPGEGFRAHIARWFGTGALAAVPQSRFEAQIKYYHERRPDGRCVTIQPYLEGGDNGRLKITIGDLDHPGGILWGTQHWMIYWTASKSTTNR